MKKDFLRKEPKSPELSKVFTDAYTALSEESKVRLLRELRKSKPEMLRELIAEAGLPRGASIPKVVSRAGSYGSTIDRWLTSSRSSNFLSYACFQFFGQTGHFFDMLSAASSYRNEAEIFAAIGEYAKQNTSDQIAVFAAAWFCAYANTSGDSFREILEDIRATPTAMQDADLLQQLDIAASRLRELATDVSNARPIVDQSWSEALALAKRIINAIDDEIEMLCNTTRVKPRDWTTREELTDIFSELRQLASEEGAKSAASAFLKTLSSQVSKLLPKHKLASKRKSQERVRDEASTELSAVSESQTPIWIELGPKDAPDWLRWIATIEAEELEQVVEQLAARNYPNTAELCADLETSYDFPATTEEHHDDAVPPSSGPPKDFRVKSGPAEGKAETTDPVVKADTSKRVHQQTLEKETAEQAKPSSSTTSVPSSAVAQTSSEESNAAATAGTVVPEPIKLTESDADNGTFLVQKLAQAVLDASDDQIEQKTCLLLWSLLRANERQIAWHLLRAAIDEKGMISAFLLPPEVLEVLSLLSFYSADFPEATDRVRDLLDSVTLEVFKPDEYRDNALRRLLLAAAVFQPALQDKASNAAELLKGIKLGKLSHVQKAQVGIQDFASTAIQISPTILSSVLNAQSWGDGEDKLIAELRAFRESAPKRSITFAPAMKIWRSWFVRGGLFASLFELGESRANNSIEDLRTRLEQLDLPTEIDRTLRQEKGKFTVTGTALAQLQRQGEEAKRLLRRRVDHHQTNPKSRNDHRKEVIHELSAAFDGMSAKAQLDIEQYVGSDFPQDDRGRVAGSLLVTEISRVEQFLKGQLTTVSAQDISLALNVDLLRLQGYAADERWNCEDPRGVFGAIVKGLTKPLRTWEQAFQAALQSKDHLSARRLLDRMAFDKEVGTLEAWEKAKDKALQEHRTDIDELIDSREAEIGAALAKGWLLAETFSKLSDEVQGLRTALKDENSSVDAPYNLWERRLNNVCETIERGREEQKSQLFKELDHLATGSQEERDKIRRALEENDFSLANDYLTQLRDEGLIQPRHDALRSHIFSEFFESTGGPAPTESQLHSYLTSAAFNPAKLFSDISASRDVGGHSLDDAGLKAEAIEALKLWFEWAKDPKPSEERIVAIMHRLGFPLPKVTKRSPGSFEATFSTPVDCPVPDFGSELKNKLYVLCDTKSTTAEDALGSMIRHGLQTRPTLLLWFKPVTASTRRAFARICREKSHKVLLVDTVLALFILLRGSEKLRTLFECSLPFTTVTPYTSAGGNLPDEMFFGRRAEMRSIESRSPDGACFVYGGRQIGKTVLLKKVARDFASSSKKQLSLYLDLNSYAIGTEASMEDVWRIMAEELHKKDATIFGAAVTRQMAPEKFLKSITAWLAQDHERRILILLDEADAMLTADGSNEVDGQQFRMLHQLKGLMDDTDRRFKVVFAGLHNVQRTTREPNNPLVQLGSPICVRPLMSNGEAREAFRLVAEPLRVCGAKVENLESTINSILARTNYYPNLIQIVSDRLLKTAVERQLMVRSKDCPPYHVTTALMEDMFNKRDVRAELQQKLLLTLDLDKRYFLIAHIVASNRKHKPDGLTSGEIAEESKVWWSAGFTPDPRTTEDEERYQFQILLEEMCGLGVLRQPQDGVFTLRSPNVAVLLGNDDEVLGVINSASDWDPPVQYSPDTFRGTDKRGNQSPLTAKQERVLLFDPAKQVFVAVGPFAAGLDDVVTRLREKTGKENLKELEPESNHERFESVLSDLIKSRREGAKTLLVVPSSCTWDLKWVQTAKTRLSRISIDNKPAGVLFLADPAALWELAHQWDSIQAALADGGDNEAVRDSLLRLGTYSKSALKKFLLDSGRMLSNPETVAAVTEATGLWRTLLLLLREAMHEEGWKMGRLSDGTFQKELVEAGYTPEKLFGIKDDERRLVLEALAIGGSATLADLAAYVSSDSKVTKSQVSKVVEWALALGIVTKANDEITIDPFLARQLNSQTPA